MVRYPHIANLVSGNGYTTSPNGDLVPVVLPAPVSFTCRAEPANDNGYVIGAGGTRVDFAWVVYCGKEITHVPVGAAMTILDSSGQTLCEDTVKRFSAGQLNSRIWL